MDILDKNKPELDERKTKEKRKMYLKKKELKGVDEKHSLVNRRKNKDRLFKHQVELTLVGGKDKTEKNKTKDNH